jgi:RND superfamily putative drug exporter
MSRFLYRLARFCAAKRSVVIGVWLAIFIGLGVVAFTGMEVSSGDIEIPGTESSEALTSLEQLFPGSDEETVSMQLVFHAASGSVADPETATAIDSAVNSARSVPNVLDVSEANVSSDGTVAVAEVTMADLDNETALIDEVTGGLESAVEPIQATGIIVEFGGSLTDPEVGLSITEILGAVIAFVVLVLTFGSLSAAGANMLNALIGVVIGVTGVFAWSAVSPIEDSTLLLAMMLGLAVGIDYSLFVLSRFRDELRAGRSVDDAVPMAVGTAGSAVVFAGLTVVIALAGLTIVNIPPITEMGLAAAGIVVFAVALSLTIMPVFLRTLGHRALPRRERSNPVAVKKSSRIGLFERWANVVTSFPKQTVIAAVALLAIVSIPFFSM